MSSERQDKRPSLPVRYERFTAVQQAMQRIERVIERLKNEYRLTHNDEVLQSMQDLQEAQQKLHRHYWAEEDEYRDDELRELLNHDEGFAHSVVVWAKYYIDDENAS